MMKKLLCLLLSLLMLFSVAACGDKSEEAPEVEYTELSLWVYPLGNWGDAAAVEALLSQFQVMYPHVRITPTYLDSENWTDRLYTAVSSGLAPDIVLGSVDKLTTQWGAEGLMADLSALWDDSDYQEIGDAVHRACFDAEGRCWVYPLAMEVGCMAINRDAFEASEAIEYIDLETRTWSTEDFIHAVDELEDTYGDTAAAIYCGDQQGDDGIIALVNNLYGGTFTNEDNSDYAVNSEANAQGLDLLMDMDGIDFDTTIAGRDEAHLFYREVLQMSFCWDVSQQRDPAGAGTGSGKTADGSPIEFVYFPTEDGSPAALRGQIYGFGCFDNGDEDVLSAAKMFVKYFADGAGAFSAVRTTGLFPVRGDGSSGSTAAIWSDDPLMLSYGALCHHMGQYDRMTPHRAEARTAWNELLQRCAAEDAEAATEMAKFRVQVAE